MSEQFITLNIKCSESVIELLIAELSMVGFDSFLENEDGMEASAQSGAVDHNLLDGIFKKYRTNHTIGVERKTISKQNWNKEWEKNYEPVIVDNKCLIHADFHQLDEKYPYEILINPKMSFGTGHHDTTSLMITIQMEINHQNKYVIDAGCGTGILSIMAEKLGASRIDACDIDEWAVVNSLENVAKNNCKKINVMEGTVEVMHALKNCDILLANINKNILIEEMQSYSGKISSDGLLVISGFLKSDIPDLKIFARKLNFSFISEKSQNNWAALVFQKKTG